MEDRLCRDWRAGNELKLIQGGNEAAQIRLIRGNGNIQIESQSLDSMKNHGSSSRDDESHSFVHQDAKNLYQMTLLRLAHLTISSSRARRANRARRTRREGRTRRFLGHHRDTEITELGSE